jgi:TRAP-type C4-dicarboxylate transport system permease large subunit/TRAP-type C4-dicarboxylate transport system permease small subunit
MHLVEQTSVALPRMTGAAGVLQKAEQALGSIVAAVAASLVVAEIIVLFTGVSARYLFHKPIIWSDELAGILFLWLAMLGAVVAFQRAEHMRMTAIVGMVSQRTRAFFDVLAIVAPLAFLALVLQPAYEFASDEAMVSTPALDISNLWRAAALPVGLGLMLLVALLRLLSFNDWRLTGAAAAVVAVVGGALYFLSPVLVPLGNLNLLIFFVVLVAIMVFAAVPIAFAFGLATFAYITLTTSTPSTVVIGRMDEGMSHLILLSVPLFVFLGLLIEMTGMARAMVGFLASLLGHVRGGLQYVLVAAMYLVSGISGAKAADMAAVAPVLFPEMVKRGAKPGDLVALLSATGAQTETIPPSLVLITIGSVTGVSIAALFTGGLLPGLVLAIMLCAVVGGVATATEVSTIGIVYSVLAGLLIYRNFDWRRLYPMLTETAALSGAILLIIGAATGMAWALTQSGFSTSLAAFMTGLPGGAPMFLAVTIVAFIVLGSVLEGIPAIVLFGPLLFPIAKQVGVHEVHYAMVVILAMGIGLFAPPFGVGYYAACAISRIHPDEGIRPMLGYMLALLIGTIIIAAVPWISIGLLH